mgnify:CR=1 FL=1
MKIKVRRETARCTNCGKINEFYYLSDFLYGERLVIFHNGMSYAYINLLEDDVYNDFIDNHFKFASKRIFGRKITKYN